VNGEPRAISAICVLMERVKALEGDGTVPASKEDMELLSAVRAVALLADTCAWVVAEIDNPANAVKGFEHLDFLARIRIAHRLRTILGVVHHLDEHELSVSG